MIAPSSSGCAATSAVRRSHKSASKNTKVEAASKFNKGYTTVEYLSAAIIDMELHTKADGMVDADAFERDTLKAIGGRKEVALRHRLVPSVRSS